MSQSISQMELKSKLQFKPLQILLLFIMLLLTIIELKYKQGDQTPLFEGDDAGVLFSLVGLSLAVYFVTWVALAFTNNTTTTTNSVSILIWHVSCTSGALACGLLSSILVPSHGWLIFFFYALPLWVAPCKPHLRIIRLFGFRPPADTQQDDDSIAVILEERPEPHLHTSPTCSPSEDPFAS